MRVLEGKADDLDQRDWAPHLHMLTREVQHSIKKPQKIAL
jgi:hypothetical protein